MTPPIDTALQVNEVQELRSPMQGMPESGPLLVFDRPVRTGDVDEEKRLRLDGVARYLQDIASDQVEAMGEELINPVWIVRRTVIDVVRPITWPTRVHLERWCSAMSTRWTTMRVNIDGEDGGRVETEAFWININPENGMPARIGDELEAVLTARTVEHRLRWRPLLKEVAPDLDEAGLAERPFPLRFTDIDPMRHLNNAVYLQAVEALLDEHEGLRSAPHRTIIEYLRPIARDSVVSIRSRRDQAGLAVWFIVEGQERARAQVLAL